MGTLVCFHAHPDDEAIATGGLMVKASAAGHRVILVCATRGECGEPQPDVLNNGELLWQRRMIELDNSASILGADRPIWLGYEDSGMMGEQSNSNPACLWQADLDEAVDRLARLLAEVDADVLTIYDDHGGYGHPDHIRVHQIGKAAATSLGIDNVFESTMNRDHMRRLFEAQEAQEAQDSAEESAEGPPDFDIESMGTTEAEIGFRVDVTAVIDTKRAAMAAHRSQIAPDSFFFTMPPEHFTVAFGSEWFNVCGQSHSSGPTDVDLLPGLS